MEDSDLIAKLSFGDMHAQDAVYHASCHTKLRTDASLSEKRKQIERNAKEQNLNYLNKHAESIALSEIVIDIEDEGDSPDRKYALTDLFKRYQERLKS